jgi:hypothetical protein
MNKDQIIETLQGYADELQGILLRFEHTSNSLDIQNEDNYRMRQISSELYDLISDHVPNSDTSLGRRRYLRGEVVAGIGYHWIIYANN